jgi:hypothetical protein
VAERWVSSNVRFASAAGAESKFMNNRQSKRGTSFPQVLSTLSTEYSTAVPAITSAHSKLESLKPGPGRSRLA